MNTTSRYYPSQPRLADLGRVPGSVAAVFEYLKSTARKLSELWESAATIAAKLGYSRRTVQDAIKRLVEAGLLAIRTDYGLNTRRAIVMLWRVEARQPSESQAKPSESDHVLHRAECAVAPVARPEPAAETEAQRAPEAPEAVADQLEAVEVIKTTGRKATTEEVAKLIDDASRLRGADPKSVKRLCRLHTYSVVRAAVSHALANGKHTWVWVVKCAVSWAEQGIPEYAKPKRIATAEEIRATIGEAKVEPLSEAECEAHWKMVLENNSWCLDKVAGHLELFQ